MTTITTETALPRIGFVGTGGTIASIGTDRFDLLDYAATDHRVDAQTLVDRTGFDGVLARLIACDFCNRDSATITQKDWSDLACFCTAMARENPDLRGIVIGHGTASLEETAYALSLALHLPVPVVLTGSMRPLSGLSSDADANLAAALRVASSAERGVFVVLNDEIHLPRAVTKADTLRLDAFRSPGSGPIGYVNGSNVEWAGERCVPAALFDVEALKSMPRVDIAYSHVGSDGCAIRAFAAAGARGIVSAGFGPGIATPGEAAALAEAVQTGIVVVQAFRGASGHVVDGSFNRALDIIPAGNLSPQKARILLGLCLAAGKTHAEVRRLFGGD